MFFFCAFFFYYFDIAIWGHTHIYALIFLAYFTYYPWLLHKYNDSNCNLWISGFGVRGYFLFNFLGWVGGVGLGVWGWGGGLKKFLSHYSKCLVSYIDIGTN
jgi:hypothetical protein